MTDEQEKHLAELIQSTAIHMDSKYRRGQAEHGGNLFDLSALQLVDAAIDEATDQLVYLRTLRAKLVERG